MALARPVVASRCGGLAESVVHEGTGLLVAPGDAEALASALARLLADPELSARLGRAGPERVRERYHVDAMVDGYERIYREILDEGPRR
jgi:glycosyltransferase involved in cell wall biosynthesis